MIMELIVLPKGNKFIVTDKKNRLLYTIKKKGFGARYVLLDASDYNLYTLLQIEEGSKPRFRMILNDDTFMLLTCKSLFLDPTIEGRGQGLEFDVVSKDRKEFKIIRNNAEVGAIHTQMMPTGDLQYEIEIDNKAFDDYIPLFAIAIEKAFGDMNKNK